MKKSILFCVITAILLIAAYWTSWLAWLTWIAFVPFILAVQRQKRLQVYFLTAILVLISSAFIAYVTNLWRLWPILEPILFLFAFIVLISEIQIQSRRFINYSFVVVAFIWTFLLITLRFIAPSQEASLSAIVSIMPVSQPIFQSVAGTFGTYVILFAVIFINGTIAFALSRFSTKPKIITVASAIIFAVFFGLVGGPIRDLPTSTPEDQGMNSKILMEMSKSIPESYAQIRSVLIVRHRHTVFEQYFQNCTPHSFHEICSDTKSFTGSLLGIAIDKGYIKSTNQKIVDFFPEYTTWKIDPEVKNITIQNLLTMSSGFNWDDFSPDRDQLYNSENWIKSVFELPVANEPGKVFNYNSPATHILSGIINRASQMDRSQFADRFLFGQLGIYRRIWSADSRGINFGFSSIFMNSRDMAKFGEMYLRNGLWNGKQVVSQKWVQESTSVQNGGGQPEEVQYGYLFWITDIDGHKAYFAGGQGGQYICVIPDFDLVVVITATTDPTNGDDKIIIPMYIIPAIIK